MNVNITVVATKTFATGRRELSTEGVDMKRLLASTSPLENLSKIA
jgi:hypothetical protein